MQEITSLICLFYCYYLFYFYSDQKASELMSFILLVSANSSGWIHSYLSSHFSYYGLIESEFHPVSIKRFNVQISGNKVHAAPLTFHVDNIGGYLLSKESTVKM